MSKGAYDVFALVINFLGNDWQPKYTTISLFEATKNIGQALAKNLTELLDKYGLKRKIIVNVKNEGLNFNAITTILKVVQNCESHGLK
jgi:hypothetical protein